MLTEVIGDIFKCWSPYNVMEKSGEGEQKLGIIEGIASSEKRDADKDVLVQDGGDWSLFKSRGFIVHEHPFHERRIVGEPLEMERVEVDGYAATRLKAGLYLADPDGKMLFEKSQVLQKSSDLRRFGFSAEGGVLERDPKDRHRVTKWKVHTVVVTAFPKNDQSWFEPLAASLLARFGGLDSLLRAEAIGYPAQGEAAAGVGGIGKTVGQSLEGVKGGKMSSKTYGMSPSDAAAVILLKQFPQWTWAQGIAVAKSVIQRLNQMKEKAR